MPNLSKTFIPYLEATIELLTAPLDFIAKRDFRENDVRESIFGELDSILMYMISQRIPLTEPRAEFCADVENYRRQTKRGKRLPDVEPAQHARWMIDRVQTSRNPGWSPPLLGNFYSYEQFDQEHNTGYWDFAEELNRNYVRTILKCDDQHQGYIRVLDNFDEVCAKGLQRKITPRRQCVDPANYDLIDKLEECIMFLTSMHTTLLKYDGEMSDIYGTARGVLSRSIFGVASYMIAVGSRSEAELTVLRDVGVHFRLLRSEITLTKLETKVNSWFQNNPVLPMPLDMEFLRGRAFNDSECLNESIKMHLAICDRLFAVTGKLNQQQATWVQRLKSHSANLSVASKALEMADRMAAPRQAAAASRDAAAAFFQGDSSSSKPVSQNPVHSAQNPVAQNAASATPGADTSAEELKLVMDELHNLIGLERVKEDVQELVNFLKIQKMRADKGLPCAPISRHLVFYGNPGTGKTTVARLLAAVYKAMGTIEGGQLIEADRSKMVGQFSGSTAINVRDVVEEALGGVLFIDEAYTLVQKEGDNFGQEAVDTLLKLMEDHRDQLIVIVAGYTDKMNGFLNSNPGFRSRFNKYFFFDDYNPDQLVQIFDFFCHQSGFHLAANAQAKLHGVFSDLYAHRNENFGNAREARNIFERAITNQANRIVRFSVIDDRMLTEINADDIPAQPIQKL